MPRSSLLKKTIFGNKTTTYKNKTKYVNGKNFSMKNNSIMSSKTTPLLIIPALNTFTGLDDLPPRIYTMTGVFRTKEELPEYFSWAGEIKKSKNRNINEYGYGCDYSTEKTDEKKKVKSKLTLPSNQGSCGSCWAISTAKILSDIAVVSRVSDINPKLSTSSLLSCLTVGEETNMQCNGGYPDKAALYVHENGIYDNNCFDYSWCEQNSNCINSSQSSIKNQSNLVPEKNDLSTLIPTCGCVINSDPIIYKIEKPDKIIVDKDLQNNDTTLENVEERIKTFIYNNGPVSGSYIVPDNFKPTSASQELTNSGFTEGQIGYGTPSGLKQYEGIFLETIDYGKTKESGRPVYIRNCKMAGGHAVALIGWGISKNKHVIEEGGDQRYMKDWICRNSWTENWGDSGYFKLAQFPFNKVSCFEVSNKGQIIMMECDALSCNDYENNQYNKGDLYPYMMDQTMNGVMCMTMNQKPKKTRLEKNDYDGMLIKDISFYENNSSENNSSENNSSENNSSNHNTSNHNSSENNSSENNSISSVVLIFGIIFPILFFLFLIVFFIYKNKMIFLFLNGKR